MDPVREDRMREEGGGLTAFGRRRTGRRSKGGLGVLGGSAMGANGLGLGARRLRETAGGYLGPGERPWRPRPRLCIEFLFSLLIDSNW